MFYRTFKINKGIFFITLGLNLSLFANQGHANLSCRQLFKPARIQDHQWQEKIDESRPLTNSQKFLSLENETPERLQWILEQNHKMNLKLKSSPNRKSIEAWLFELHSKQRIKVSKELSHGAQLQVVSEGLDKPEELRLISKDNVSQVLLSTAQYSRKQLVHIVNLEVSPNEKYLAFSLIEKGSLDQFKIGIYDLEKMEVLKESALIPAANGVVEWLGTTLYLNTTKGNQEIFQKYDLTRPQEPPVPIAWEVLDGNGDYILGSQGKSKYIMAVKGVYKLPQETDYSKIIGMNEKYLYLKMAGKNGEGEVHRLSLPLQERNLEPQKWLNLPKGTDRLLKFSEDHLFVRITIGAKDTVFIYDQSAKLLAAVEAPPGLVIGDVSFKKGEQKLLIQLKSKVVKSMEFEYDLIKQKFSISPEEIVSRMLIVDGHIFESFIAETTSADGRVIPMRITKLKNLSLNGSNPVYMEVYGGFGVASNFYPNANPIVTDFLMRGGIAVDPAIRGGNEFGEAWHQEAVKEKKINTFNDLIASARYLVSQNYTQPAKIIIRGTSNGGLTVAATAMQSPKDFGLVIPINGVQDLLRKEVLDESFYRGWSYEYGDSTKPEDYKYLSVTSPVEKIKDVNDHSPLFFILNGRQDSRVNSAHSFKLYAAIEEKYPNNVYLSSINNSGHWNASINYQDLIAWRANVLIWTMIYDQIGWSR